MSGHFVLTLDTTAPTVTFGAAGGTTAGELLELLYTVDEPGVESASIKLADNRVLALDVLSDRFQVLLPADTPDGLGRVTVKTVDAYLNRRTQTQNVQLHGVIVVPPDEPPVTDPFVPAPPSQPARRRPTIERRRDHAVVRITTRSRIRAELHDEATIIARSDETIDRSTDHSTAEVTSATRSRTRVRRRDTSTARVTETTAIAKRFRGQGEEDDLIFLGLL